MGVTLRETIEQALDDETMVFADRAYTRHKDDIGTGERAQREELVKSLLPAIEAWVAERERIEPLHGPDCPYKPYEDSYDAPEDVLCTCGDLSARWKARAILARADVGIARRQLANAEARITKVLALMPLVMSEGTERDESVFLVDEVRALLEAK